MDFIEKYYRTQTYIDLGWREFSWFNDSLIELMAILYLLERVDIVIKGTIIYYCLVGAFAVFFVFGFILKKFGVYDKAQYVDADIDPVQREILEAARRINKALPK